MHGTRGGFLVLGVSALLIGYAILAGGGSSEGRLFWVGLSALAAAAAVAVAVSAGILARPLFDRATLLFLGLFAAFVVWNGVSVQWSIDSDASWRAFNRDLVYLAFAVLGVYAGALVRRSTSLIASALLLVLTVTLAWALASKVFPGLDQDYGRFARFARLREPVGYWNVLALLGGVALVLSLWLVSSRRLPTAVRAAGVVVAYAAIVTTVLTYSRAGILVAALMMLAWLAVGGRAFDSIATLVIAAPAALAVLAVAFQLNGISEDFQTDAVRRHDGWVFGATLAGVALLVYAIALVGARTEQRDPPSRQAERGAVAGVLVSIAGILAVALAVVVVRAGGPTPFFSARWHEFSRASDTVTTQSKGRLASLNSNFRWNWWSEGWRSFTGSPLNGQGAGSFALVNRLERTNDIAVGQPHDLPLQILSDVGIVGFVLFAAGLVAAAFAGLRALRRLEGIDRRALVALGVAACGYFVQSLVDIDWQYVAATAPAFFVLGAFGTAGVPVERPARRPLAVVAVAAILATTGASLLAPWLGDRKLADALGQLDTRPAQAADDAGDARELNPLDVDPLLAQAYAETALGRRAEAYAHYRDAVDLQPKNADTWYAVGAFELLVLKQPRVARAHLARAKELDPYGVGDDVDDLLSRR